MNYDDSAPYIGGFFKFSYREWVHEKGPKRRKPSFGTFVFLIVDSLGSVINIIKFINILYTLS